MASASVMRTVATCAAALAVGLAGCGSHKGEPGLDEPAREGLAIPVAGVAYNVFITRPLNLRITPDKAYYAGPEAERGSELWGIFLNACNEKGAPKTPTEDFTVEDNQGNEFKPIELPEDNEWAYRSRRLEAGECIPEAGSVAEQGPTKGSMLLFEFSIETTENRPLELFIRAFNPANGKTETKNVELDL